MQIHKFNRNKTFSLNCVVRPIWEELLKIIKDKYDVDFTVSNSDKIFGVFEDKFLTYFCV